MESLAKDVSAIKKQNKEILDYLKDCFPFVKLTPQAKKEKFEILGGFMGLIFDLEDYKERINELLNHPKFSSLSDEDKKNLALLKFATESKYLEEVSNHKDKATNDFILLNALFQKISSIEFTIKSL
ncbi:hypothetical protein FEDK69T_22960 [Flavobacterium enshiense DK69]|uniref:Uncharacterized protein n=1 Tax=Flavobacterium enshiense DK69 TaxID=1107311 RepID=V6S6J1_9FLAO|nr:hypothetical protein [Flavobacterium enshiense]ESU22313.1 hypothetical protein FEDK69T_22960 [Flavobacterium enshiense DK69]KGO97317.1 hypothetical protein Q767_01575 [Flavobacterium enshiense DK69]